MPTPMEATRSGLVPARSQHKDPTLGPNARWGQVAVDRSTGLPIADYSWLPKGYHATYQCILEMDEGIALLHMIAPIQVLPPPAVPSAVASTSGSMGKPASLDRITDARVLLLSCEAVYLCSDNGDILVAFAVEAIKDVLLCDEWICLCVARRNECSWDVAFRLGGGCSEGTREAASPSPRRMRTLPTTQMDFLAILNATRALADAPKLLPVVVASPYAISSRLLHTPQGDLGMGEEPPPIPFLSYEAVRNAEHPNILIDVLSFQHRLRCPRLEPWELEKRSLDGLRRRASLPLQPDCDPPEDGVKNPIPSTWRPQVHVQSPRSNKASSGTHRSPPHVPTPSLPSSGPGSGKNKRTIPPLPVDQRAQVASGGGNEATRRVQLPKTAAVPSASQAAKDDKRRRLQALLDDDDAVTDGTGTPSPPRPQAVSRVDAPASTGSTYSEGRAVRSRSASNDSNTILVEVAVSDGDVDSPRPQLPTARDAAVMHRPTNVVVAPGQRHERRIEALTTLPDEDHRKTSNRFMSPTSSAIARRESAAAERRAAVALRAEQRAQDVQQQLDQKAQRRIVPAARPRATATKSPTHNRSTAAGSKQSTITDLRGQGNVTKSATANAARTVSPRSAVGTSTTPRSQRTPSPRSAVHPRPYDALDTDGTTSSTVGRRDLMQLWEELKTQRQSLDLLTRHVEAMVLRSPTPADDVREAPLRAASKSPPQRMLHADAVVSSGPRRGTIQKREDFDGMTRFQRSLLTRPLQEIHDAAGVSASNQDQDAVGRPRTARRHVTTMRKQLPTTTMQQVSELVQASTKGTGPHHLKATRATRRHVPADSRLQE